MSYQPARRLTAVFKKDKIKQTKLVGFMFKISTRTQYGLRLMIYLARHKKRICPLEEIAKQEKLPFNYLEKIIGRLKKDGLVKARKGSRGGYFLARKADRITLKEVVFSLEPRKYLVRCADEQGRKYCSLEKKCLAKKFWQKIQQSLEESLSSITLADLLPQKYED